MKEDKASRLAEAVIAIAAKAFAEPPTQSPGSTRIYAEEEKWERLLVSRSKAQQALKVFLQDRFARGDIMHVRPAARTLDAFYHAHCGGTSAGIFEHSLSRRKA